MAGNSVFLAFVHKKQMPVLVQLIYWVNPGYMVREKEYMVSKRVARI